MPGFGQPPDAFSSYDAFGNRGATPKSRHAVKNPVLHNTAVLIANDISDASSSERA